MNLRPPLVPNDEDVAPNLHLASQRHQDPLAELKTHEGDISPSILLEGPVHAGTKARRAA